MLTSESEWWVPDDEHEVCQVCKITNFYEDILFQKHHCRACGKARDKSLSCLSLIAHLLQLVCKLCSTKKGYFEDENKSERVCDNCYIQCKSSGKCSKFFFLSAIDACGLKIIRTKNNSIIMVTDLFS